MGLGFFGDSKEDVIRQKIKEDALKAEWMRTTIAERFQLDPGDGEKFAQAVAGLSQDPNFGLEQNVTDANATVVPEQNATVAPQTREEQLMGDIEYLQNRNQKYSGSPTGWFK